MRTGVELSNAKTNGRTADGLAMLEWSVRQGIRFCSWSVETVYTSATRSLAQKLAAELPGSVAFGVFDGVNFGAPQNRWARRFSNPRQLAGPCWIAERIIPLDRTRLVMSTPEIIKRINEAPACGRVSMDEAIRTASIKLPKGATHVKNSSPLKEGTALRPERPGFRSPPW